MTDIINPTGNEQLELLLEESSLRGARRAERYPGKKFFGYFCSYWPEEAVLAAGLEPLRLLPGPGNATPAELPAYCCSLARGVLAAATGGALRDLAGVGFAHTCDTMQCLGGIWEEIQGRDKTVTLVPPVMLKGQGAFSYYKKEMTGCLNRLGEISGQSPGVDDLRKAVNLCGQARLLAAEVDRLRPQLPSQLVSSILRAGQIMPKEDYIETLKTALPALNQMAKDPGDRQGLLVSGAVLENDSLFRMIEELGGRVVADDTCTGYRHYAGPVEMDPEAPLDMIVRRYSEMPPCPCRHRELEERAGYLGGLARERRARGAVVVIRKYCDPHAWDAVPLAAGLSSLGIRTLVLELEGADAGGPERTRLQAFIESLG